MNGASVFNLQLEFASNVISGTQGECETFCESSSSNALTQKISQFVQPKLLSNAVGVRYGSNYVVVTIRNGDILNDITCMNDVMSRWRHLEPQVIGSSLI